MQPNLHIGSGRALPRGLGGGIPAPLEPSSAVCDVAAQWDSGVVCLSTFLKRHVPESTSF
jgi:hypothetical protein